MKSYGLMGAHGFCGLWLVKSYYTVSNQKPELDSLNNIRPSLLSDNIWLFPCPGRSSSCNDKSEQDPRIHSSPFHRPASLGYRAVLLLGIRFPAYHQQWSLHTHGIRSASCCPWSTPSKWHKAHKNTLEKWGLGGRVPEKAVIVK